MGDSMLGGLGLAVSAKNPEFVVELAGLALELAESSAHGCTNMDFFAPASLKLFTQFFLMDVFLMHH